MDYKRFFTFEPIRDNKIILEGNEFYHATKVVRLKEGYKIIVNNNTNKDYYCTIESIKKHCLTAVIDSEEINETYDDTDISLYIGLCKELDTIVQKAVEMGVKNVIPFSSQHTNTKNVNYQRLNNIIMESSKQCGRSSLMELKEMTTFNDALMRAEEYESVLFFYEMERHNQIKDIDLTKKRKVAIFIGGEGGFSAEEIHKIKEKNISTLTLGKRILRVQTAVVAALALCLQGMNKL